MGNYWKETFYDLKNQLIQRFSTRIPGKKLGVAVSGGADSVALFRLLQEFSQNHELELHILHVDHAVRPESAKDADWVKKLAESSGVEFHSICLADKLTTEKGKSGFEAWARQKRLEFFSEKSAELGLDAIVTGHHAQDLVETFFIRMIRGTSPESLCGIRPLRRFSIFGKKLVIWRPLIHIYPKELRSYLKNLGQEWLEDSTNLDNNFLRNRIRNNLLPIFEEIRPKSILRMARIISDFDLYAKILRKSFFSNKRRETRETTASRTQVFLIPRKLPSILIRIAIKKWLLRNFPEQTDKINRNLIDRIYDLIVSNKCGRRVEFCEKVIIRKVESLEIIEKDSSVKNEEGFCSKLLFDKKIGYGKEIFFAQQNVEGSLCKDNPSSVDGIWLPLEIFEKGVFIRNPCPGDRFSPFGGCGGKKLSRWLIDKKISRDIRANLLVAATGNEILWVVGHAVSKRACSSFKEGWIFIRRILMP
ncbi:MAG: tRNA lysidine(34) synthetase TilS [Candidatus Riflebacteria bacterium]|nr:tRNA lysidine(34) synthetase TilS [Candidatus Riflebacteria bacterium]